MTDDDLHQLAAAYALDALDDDERRLFEAHLTACGTCPVEIAGFRETAALLPIEAHPPPARLETAILEAIGHTTQVSIGDGTVVDLSTRRRRRWRRDDGPGAGGQVHRRRSIGPSLLRVAAVVAVFVTGVAIGVARSGDGSDGSGTVEYAGPIGTETGSIGRLAVTETGIGRVIQFDTSALPILPVGEYYEMWFVAPDDAPTNPNRISAGTFHPDPDGNVDVQFAAAVDPSLYPTVEVTAEPGDGNPAATGPVVASVTIGP